MNITITDIIGTRIMHGSPGYMNEETISKVTILKHGVTIEFESQCFTQMTHEEFEDMLRYEELYYKENHGGYSVIIFCDLFNKGIRI